MTAIVHPRSIVETPRRHNPLILGAMISTLAAFVGALLSIFLTLIKFRSSFHCDSSFLTACSDACSRVLTSEYSSIAGVPISVYSTSFFMVAFALSAPLLWRPRRFAPVARPLLLAFAGVSLLIIAFLASYALFFVEGFCYYCGAIYGLTVLTAIGASLMQDESYLASLRRLFSWHLAKSSTLRNALLSLIAASSVQQLVYRSAANSSSGDPRCIVLGHLPKTSIEHGSQPTRARVSLIMDMSCAHCRREFEKVAEYSKRRPRELQIAVYHFARSGECIPSGAQAFNRHSEDAQSCMGARAAICAEQTEPGTGFAMVQQLLALQDTPELSFEDKRLLAAAAQKAGVPGIPEDLETATVNDTPFFDCLQNSAPVLSEIRAHASFAIHHHITDTPAMFITPYQEGQPLPTMYRVLGDKDRSINQLIDEATRAIDDAQDEDATLQEAT